MTLSVALVGYGSAARTIHRPLLQAEPALEVTHVVTADPRRRADAARDVPGTRLLDDADALWAVSADVDVVVLATPNTTHVPLALAALERGLATVVDKPLALTAADAAVLAQRAVDLGVLLTVFQNRRWDSDTLTAHALLAQGVLGAPVRLESRFARFRPKVASRWREDPAAGGGVLLDLGAHLVDQALQLLGPVTEVYAEVDAVRAGARADDDCFLALRHAGGARSHLWCSMAAPAPLPRLLLQGSAAGWSKQDLDGQEAALATGAPASTEPDGRLWDDGGGRAVASLPGDWGAFYRLLADAVTTGAPVPVEPTDAVRALEVLDAGRRSAGERVLVRLATD